MITSSNTPNDRPYHVRITPEMVNAGLTSLENSGNLPIDLYDWINEPDANLLPTTLKWEWMGNKWQAAWNEG